MAARGYGADLALILRWAGKSYVSVSEDGYDEKGERERSKTLEEPCELGCKSLVPGSLEPERFVMSRTSDIGAILL